MPSPSTEGGWWRSPIRATRNAPSVASGRIVLPVGVSHSTARATSSTSAGVRSKATFTPRAVVESMVDVLEEENPGIFSDPGKTFADLFSTAGLFLMELVRRLDAGLAEQIPDKAQRLRHIFTKQIFEMSHNELLHRITMEAVSGGVPERRAWMEGSGHFMVGNLAQMSAEKRQQIVDGMLTEGR